MSKAKKRPQVSPTSTEKIAEGATAPSPITNVVAQENVPIGDFLLEEYKALVSLYTHTETTLFSIFNFYLTLLSTVTGAIIVIAQLNIANLTLAFPGIGFLLVLGILLGIITQDAIINKNVDLAKYALAINLAKEFAFRNDKDVKRFSFYIHLAETEVRPVKPPPSTLDSLYKRLWWMLPTGMHQLFVSLMNSFALTTLTIILAVGLASASVSLWQLALVGVLVLFASFTVHCIYAQLNFKRKSTIANITMAGTKPEWDPK